MTAYDDYGNASDSDCVDSTGYYQLGSVRPGNAYLEFHYFHNAVAGWFDGAADYEHATVIPALAGESLVIDAQLALAGSISGTVTVDGGPASGHSLYVDAHGDGSNSWFSTYVNSNGEYSFVGLAPGDYVVSFSGDDVVTEYFDGGADQFSATLVTVTASATATVDADLALKPAGEATEDR